MSLLAFTALVLVAAAWFLLPLLPALRELTKPSDAEPLTMVGQDAGDLTVFADGFRQYLRRQLPDVDGPEEVQTTLLRDGTPLVRLNGRVELPAESSASGRLVSQLVVANAPVALPGGETFLLELYAQDAFTGGPEAVYRALLGERDVRLGPRSSILRWVHAERDLEVGDGSTLSGRGSAGATMRLGYNVLFTRIRAARVVVGPTDLAPPVVAPPLLSGTMKMPRTARRMRGYIRIDGDLSVPTGESLLGTIVVTGALRLGEAARIEGNVKVHGSCQLGPDAVIDGSLVCREAVTLERGSRVLGPVVSERSVSLAERCNVGAPNHPASISAARVHLASGVQVFGAVTARDDGRTGPAEDTPASRSDSRP